MNELIDFYSDNASLLLDKTLEHLEISLLAIAISLLVALPAGVWLGHLHAGSYFAINISNVFRSLPTLALIAISLAIFGLSLINVLIALVALAIPPILTNAYTSVDGVDPDVPEAARGMGMRELDILLRAELPLAWPLIFAGVRVATVYVIATAPLAALAGGGGLGDIILNQPTYQLAGVIGATLVVVLMSFAIDGLLGLLQRVVTPKGVRPPKEIKTIAPPMAAGTARTP